VEYDSNGDLKKANIAIWTVQDGKFAPVSELAK
jgi:hypothetical protein